MRRYGCFAIAALTFCAICPMVAQRQTPTVAVPEIRYEQFRMSNGLEVILHEDHKLPMVAINLWYHVGPANERAGRTGFAHLFEHMMLQGSRNLGEQTQIPFLESIGATDINATTSFDRTNYFETVPSNRLETTLWMESDRMGFLLDTLSRERLVNQRDVVRDERRRLEDAPYGVVDEELYHRLFPKGHPYYDCGRSFSSPELRTPLGANRAHGRPTSR